MVLICFVYFLQLKAAINLTIWSVCYTISNVYTFLEKEEKDEKEFVEGKYGVLGKAITLYSTLFNRLFLFICIIYYVLFYFKYSNYKYIIFIIVMTFD